MGNPTVRATSSMEANVARLHEARRSALLVLEMGTQWGDVISMMRRERSQPTVRFAGCGGRLLLIEDDERCVRVRGRCARPDQVPYARAAGVRNGFC